MMRIGVILAAGRGRRMAGTKQLTYCDTSRGAKPLVAAAYDAIQPICDQLIVVLGHEAGRVAAALGRRPFLPAMANSDAPMYESIRCGLRHARGIDPDATVVLQPGDHPEVAQSTLAALVDWSLKRPVQAIIPEYRGKGGHPVVIPQPVVALLLDADCPAGLGEFWADHPELCNRVEVEDSAVVRDIDTMDDLSR
jgi:molybdenum cofactor cytidylyltransferase